MAATAPAPAPIAPSLLFTCNGCFDDEIQLNDAITCEGGHISCATCIKRSLNVAVGQGTLITCFSGCGKPYSEQAIWKAIPHEDGLRKAYDVIVQREQLSEAAIENVYGCPFCDNKVIIENTDAAFFRCNGCAKESCRHCREEKHAGPCGDADRADWESERLILRCNCGIPLIRGEACNKLGCPQCRKKWCWICKARLGGHPYDHFYNGDRRPHGETRCPLYGERPADQVFAVNNAPAVVRNHIDRVGLIGFDVQDDYCPPPLPDNVAAGGGPIRRARVQRAVRAACRGITARGLNCRYKEKLAGSGFCLTHARRPAPAEADVMEEAGPDDVIIVEDGQVQVIHVV